MSAEPTTVSVADLVDSGRIAGEARISGLVASVEVRVNRAEREWAVLTVDDGTGHLEVLAFPKTWQSLKTQVTQGEPLTVAGRLNHDARSGRLQLFAAAPAPATH